MRFVTFTLCFGIFLFLSADKYLAQTKPVLVTGTVYAFVIDDAIAPNTQILFLSPSYHKAIYADKDGKFRVELPAGIYEIYTKEGVNIAVFKRSPIDVSAGDPQTINLYLLPECVSWGCDRLSFDIDVFKRSGDPLSVVIEFWQAKRERKSISYAGALFTYGVTTVKAKELLLDRVTGRIVARDGWIEVGNLRSAFQEKTITLGEEVLSHPESVLRLESAGYWRSLKKLDKLFDAK